MNRLISFTLAAALAAAAIQPAQAAARVDKAKVQKVLKAAGLLGFWAVDCSKAPSSDNPWETLVVDPEGYVMDGDYEGTDGEEAYVVEARRLDAHHVWFRYEVTLGEPELTLVYEIQGDRQRTWSSQDSTGEYLIKNGVWQTDEEPGQSQWYQRCPNRFPDQPADGGDQTPSN